MSGKNSAPYFPRFGVGAPGVGVPTNSPYFDTSTTPYTEYVYHAGAWHQAGINNVGNNATSIQGVPVSVAPPSLNEVLQFGGVNYAPAVVGGGAGVFYNDVAASADITRTLPDDAGYYMLTGVNAFNFQHITLPANPVDGQIIWLLCEYNTFSTYTILPNAGQVSIPSTNGHPASYDTRKYTLATTSWDILPPSAQ